MADYDCLLIGYNELDFEQYYNILQNMASSIDNGRRAWLGGRWLGPFAPVGDRGRRRYCGATNGSPLY